MIRTSLYITVPMSLWRSRTLSWEEKAVFAELLSYSDPDTCSYSKPIGKLASSLDMRPRQLQQCLAVLVAQGWLSLSKVAGQPDTYIVDASLLGYPARERVVDMAEASAVIELQSPSGKSQQYDYAAILEQWKKINPSLRQPRCFTPKMQVQLRNTLKNNKASVDDLYNAFRIIALSAFLQGNNDRKWQASMEWLISDRNGSFGKVLTGAYCNTPEEKLRYNAIVNDLGTSADDNYYR